MLNRSLADAPKSKLHIISGRTCGHVSLALPFRHVLICWLLICTLGVVVNGTAQTLDSSVGEAPKSEDLKVEEPADSSHDWGVQVGVAFISRNNVGEVLSGGFEPAKGEARGQLYSLTVDWTAHRFEIPCRGQTLTPEFGPYMTLTLVDENDASVFPDYNGGVGFRWVNFPWNRWIKTGFFMGVGLSYSSQIYTIDRVRHPGEDRSHLKFDWPIQLTFALPRWPDRQIVIYNDHQSGGHIFDEGGCNSVGVGFRIEF